MLFIVSIPISHVFEKEICNTSWLSTMRHQKQTHWINILTPKSQIHYYSYLFELINLFFYCCAGDTLCHLQRFLQCINISYLNSAPLPFFYPSPLILGIVSTGLIFLFTYMCTQHLHHIHPPTEFSSLPRVPIPLTGPVLPSSSLIL
jgi:hypothetical protein